MLSTTAEEDDERVVLLGVIFIICMELIAKEEVIEGVEEEGVGVKIWEAELEVAPEALEEEMIEGGAIRIGCH